MAPSLLVRLILVLTVACALRSLAVPRGLPMPQEEPIQLGPPMARFPEVFSQLRGLRELADGRLLVTDWVEERVVRLDMVSGESLEIGRVGQGPEEYRLPGALLPWPGDSTLLVDMGNARLAIISPEARIERLIRVERPGQGNPSGVDRRGRIYFTIPAWSRDARAGVSDSVEIARWVPDSGELERLGRIKGPTPRSQPSADPRRPSIPFVIFAPQDAWAVAPDERIAFVRSADYRVEWRMRDGSVVVGPAVEHEPLPVSERDKLDYVARFLGRSPVSGRGPRGGLGKAPAQMLTPRELERQVEVNEFARSLPHFDPSSARLSPDDELWVRRWTPAGTAPIYDVFDERGHRRGAVVLPSGRELLGFGKGALYVVLTDEVGLQTLEKYDGNLEF